MKCFFGNREPASTHNQLLKMSIQQLRAENQRIEEEEEEHEKCAECPYLFLIGEWIQQVRGKTYCPACIEEARDNDGLLFEENMAIIKGLMELYMIENHELFVKALEEYTLDNEEDEDVKFQIVFELMLGGSAFTEFAVKNSEFDEEMIESTIEEMIDSYGFDVDNLVDLYHELCNAPVLK